MKKSLFISILIIASSLVLNAQSPNLNRDKQTYLGPRKEVPENPFPQKFKTNISTLHNNLTAGKMGMLSHELNNKSKVYLLPTDGMPCIVPDMLPFNMPVIGKEIRITGMPPINNPIQKIISPVFDPGNIQDKLKN